MEQAVRPVSAPEAPFEELAVELYGVAMQFDDDQAAEEFYRQTQQLQDFWLRVAATAEEYALQRIRALPPSVDYPEHQRLVREAKRGSDSETVAELERAIVNLVLLIGKDAPSAGRIPHLGKVS
jgi:hypothetical protein